MSNLASQRAITLLEILQLQKIEEDLFLGRNEEQEPARRLFGGQVLAQAVAAASGTVEGVALHSLHGYFIRAGTSDRPVLYEVERTRDGRSFSTRRVVAIQNGVAIFSMDASFQLAEPGFEHAHPMPNVPMPDELEEDDQVAAKLGVEVSQHGPLGKLARPFEVRSVFRLGSEDWAENRLFNPVWIRFRESVDATNAELARCLLAYASDMSMVSTVSLPHLSEVDRSELQMASLDHALWIHRDVPIDQWILFHKRTSTAQGARGLVHADFFAESGELIASVSQEGLMRVQQS